MVQNGLFVNIFNYNGVADLAANLKVPKFSSSQDKEKKKSIIYFIDICHHLKYRFI